MTVFTEHEIETVYDQLGLTTAADRGQFSHFTQPRPHLQMEVVISTTSEPFSA